MKYITGHLINQILSCELDVPLISNTKGVYAFRIAENEFNGIWTQNPFSELSNSTKTIRFRNSKNNAQYLETFQTLSGGYYIINLPDTILQSSGFLYITIEFLKNNNVILTKQLDQPITIFESGDVFTDIPVPTPQQEAIIETLISMIQNSTAEATTLSAGQSATANINKDGTWKFQFGIPKGDKGDTGNSGVYIGNSSPTNDSSVWIDTSGNQVDGLAEINSTYSTINFNQLVSESCFNDSTVVAGITFTKNANNHSYSINGTVSSEITGDNVSFSSQIQKGFNINIIQGHKYLLKGCPSGGSNTTYELWLYKNGVITCQDIGNGNIVTAIGNGAAYILIRIYKYYEANNLIFTPQVFDLTAMYGVGKEPNSAAEFNAVFTSEYYPNTITDSIIHVPMLSAYATLRNSGVGGNAPVQYIQKAAINGNNLILTDQSSNTITFSPISNSSNIEINNLPVKNTMNNNDTLVAYDNNNQSNRKITWENFKRNLIIYGQLQGDNFYADSINSGNGDDYATTINGEQNKLYIDTGKNKIYYYTGTEYQELSIPNASWGDIEGSISAQTDLINLINNIKQFNNLLNRPQYNGVAITSSTNIPEVKTNIWDAKGTYSKPDNGIPASDLEQSIQDSLEKANTALQSFSETDPTVPKWAKQQTKPTYTYSEITETPSIPVITVSSSGTATDTINYITIDGVEKKIGGTATVANNTVSQWDGAKILVLGDSFSASPYDNITSWQSILATELGATVITHAKGGAKITTIIDGDNTSTPVFPSLSSFLSSTENNIANFDLIIFEGGGNDKINNTPIGQIGDLYPTQNTITGRLKYAMNSIYSLLGNNKNHCRVMFLAIPCVGASTSGGLTGYNLREATLCQAIEDTAHYSGIPCCNLYKTSGINEYTWSICTNSPNDEMHLNSYGNRVVGKQIAKFIENEVVRWNTTV